MLITNLTAPIAIGVKPVRFLDWSHKILKQKPPINNYIDFYLSAGRINYRFGGLCFSGF